MIKRASQRNIKTRRVKGKEKEGTPFSVDVETDLGQRFLVDDKKLSSRTR